MTAQKMCVARLAKPYHKVITAGSYRKLVARYGLVTAETIIRWRLWRRLAA